MPAKKTAKPTRSIRYLLSADQRLQKLSLRKVSGGAQKPKAPRGARGRKSTGNDLAGYLQLPWGIGMRGVVVGTVCVLGAAALIAAVQPSQPNDLAEMDAPVHADRWPPYTAPDAGFERRRTTAPRTPEAAPVAVRTAEDARRQRAVVSPAIAPVEPGPNAPAASPAPAAEFTAPKAGAEPAPRPAAEATAPAAAEPAVRAAALASADAIEAVDGAAVTISGCVEFDDQTFWLSDTSGADAPKARSWKSGFLRKRPARIELVDARSTLRLSSHIGQRVAATGVLVDRAMRARFVRRVGPSCS